MLMVTPETLRFLAGRERSRSRPKRSRKLTKEYRGRLIDGCARILRKGDPTPFAFEAFLRHGLRSGLCLRGWSWREADDTSSDLIQSALAQIGAKRPTWKQGQPEWTQEGVILINRVRCARCGWRLPEDHRKFCDRRCATAFHEDLRRRFDAEELGALDDAP